MRTADRARSRVLCRSVSVTWLGQDYSFGRLRQYVSDGHAPAGVGARCVRGLRIASCSMPHISDRPVCGLNSGSSVSVKFCMNGIYLRVSTFLIASSQVAARLLAISTSRTVAFGRKEKRIAERRRLRKPGPTPKRRKNQRTRLQVLKGRV
jgi:hypothetical protein